MNVMDNPSEPHITSEDLSSSEKIEHAGDVEAVQFHSMDRLEDVNTSESITHNNDELSELLYESKAMLDSCASSKENDAITTSQRPPSEDAVTQPPSMQLSVPIECEKDRRVEPDVALEEEVTSYDGSTTTCASSSVSEEVLFHEDRDKQSGNSQSDAEIGYMRWTLPPSSSPLPASSQGGIMSSPIRRTTANEGGRDECDVFYQQCSATKGGDRHSDAIDATPDMAWSGKRKRSEFFSTSNETKGSCRFPESRLAMAYGNVIPNPKRLTIRSQRLQHERLKTPFKSPLVVCSESRRGPELQLTKPVEAVIVSKTDQVEHSTSRTSPKINNDAENYKSNTPARNNHRTARAAMPFKSPLSSDPTTKSGDVVRMTPDIQALERKSQIVKRALKIKQEDQEHDLEYLARKWIDAGREVAWELWSLVKDNDASNQCKSSWSSKAQSWGWNESVKKESGAEERLGMSGIEMDDSNLSGYHNQPSSDAEEEPIRNNPGVVLRQLGIDPETLGWDEEEGMFVDN